MTTANTNLKATMSHAALSASLAFSFAAVADTAHAQQAAPAAPTGQPVELQEIEVQGAGSGTGTPENTNDAVLGTTRVPTSVLDTPQSVNVISAEQIEQRQTNTLAEALRNVPGITVNAGEGGGGTPGGDNFNIRGFSAQGSVFLDGLRDTGQFSRDLFNLEQVEVFQGASGSSFGRGVGGGAINLATKTAKDHFFADFESTVGTYDYFRGTADINAPINENIAARINIMGHDQSVSERDFVEQQRWGIAPTVTFGMVGPTSLTLSYLHQEENNVPDYGVPYLNNRPGTEEGIRRDAWYGFLDDFEDTVADVFTATFKHEFDNGLRFTNVTRIGNYDRDRTVTPQRIAPSTQCATPGAVAGQVVRCRRPREIETFTVTNQSTLEAEFATGGLNHQLVLGADVNYEDHKQINYNDGNGANVPPLDIFNPGEPGFGGSSRVFTGQIDSEVNSYGLSIYDRVELGHGFFAIGSFRYERYEVDYETRDASNVVNPASSGTQEENLITYQAALQYKPWENHTYYISASHAELPLADPTTSDGLGGTVGFDPEEVDTYEIGGKVNFFGDRLGVGANLFYTERSNMRVTDVNNVVTLEGVRRARGFDFQVNGRITDAWAVNAAYTFIDSKIVDPTSVNNGNEMFRVPKHSWSLWSTYDVTENFTVGAGLTYVGKRWTNEANTAEAPDQLVLDAVASYKWDNITFQLNALNLTNELTYERFHGAQVVPGPGRTILLSTRVSF